MFSSVVVSLHWLDVARGGWTESGSPRSSNDSSCFSVDGAGTDTLKMPAFYESECSQVCCSSQFERDTYR